MLQYTRLAQMGDLNAIMPIIADAKQALKAAGSSQWQGTYPSRADISADLQAQHGFVLIADGQVAGYAAVIVGPEPTYQHIDGAWINEKDDYATIHRICFSNAFRGHGLAKVFMGQLISLQFANGVRNFRIDTSRVNQAMQRVIDHAGFHYRGIIRVSEDTENPERLAYELNI